MPKIKSHSGAKKRFFVSKTGKVKHKKQGLRHLLTGMAPAHGRNLRKMNILNKTDSKMIKKLIPYA
ncbi:MAG: 50S ribosomal protein L35 [Elusimicrobia bacterium]|nr:50S ribosomal protein L35 [Candidatus Liberimonas magnetica]